MSGPNYPAAVNEVGYAGGVIGGEGKDWNPTVGENIEQQIARHQAEITRLEGMRKTLEPLLHMRIQDLRQAMHF